VNSSGDPHLNGSGGLYGSYGSYLNSSLDGSNFESHLTNSCDARPMACPVTVMVRPMKVMAEVNARIIEVSIGVA